MPRDYFYFILFVVDHLVGAVKKKYIIVKLSDYETQISREHESFCTLFSYVCRIDLSRNEAWEIPKLIKTLQSWRGKSPNSSKPSSPEGEIPKLINTLQSWRDIPKLINTLQSWRGISQNHQYHPVLKGKYSNRSTLSSPEGQIPKLIGYLPVLKGTYP